MTGDGIGEVPAKCKWLQLAHISERRGPKLTLHMRVPVWHGRLSPVASIPGTITQHFTKLIGENMLSRLIDAHPTLFEGRRLPDYSALPDGWYSVADALFGEIEASFSDENLAELRVARIGSNCGRLEIILTGSYSEELDILLSSAACLSEITCEECGDVPASLRQDEVDITLCDFCQYESTLRKRRSQARPYF